jgi:DNA mismatch repair protein MutS2
MEARTLALLEFPKVLAALSHLAVSEAGAAACRAIAPASDPAAVARANLLLGQALRFASESGFKLAPFPPLDGLFAFLDRPANVLDLDALAALREVLALGRMARDAVAPYEARGFDLLAGDMLAAPWPARTHSGLRRCLGEDGRIRDEASPELLGVRQDIRAIHQRCATKVKDFILGENLSHFLQDEFMTVASDRYVLPLKANFKGRFPGIIHDYSQTGETCYFEPLFLVEMNNRLQELKQEERAEERKILEFLTGLCRQERDAAEGVYHGLVELDVLLAKAALASVSNGVPLELFPDAAIHLRDARHPLLALTPRQALPLDIELLPGQRALVVSGGNAGGKTVCLKTLGLMALMAQSGLPVPAAEGGTLPVFSKVFVVMGDEQSLEDHVSTFTAQIRYIGRVFDQVDAGTLFILDEFGAGTDPTQGAALAQALIDGLLARGAHVFVATHFPALKAYALAAEGVRAASVLFDPRTKKPLFRLAYDQVGASIALDVAREHGLPEDILRKAEQYLLLDGSDTSSVLDRLNTLAADRDKELTALRKERDRLAEKRRKLDEETRAARQKLLSEIQAESRRILESWQKEKAGRKQALKELGRLKERLAEPVAEPVQPPANAWDLLLVGTRATYPAWGKQGVVAERDERKRQVKLNLDGVLMWVKGDDLVPVGQPGGTQAGGAQAGARSGRSGGGAGDSGDAGEGASQSLTLRVDLRGLYGDEAMAALEAFLDKALMRGATGLEIVHGKGTGALRRETAELLKRNPAVASFRLANEEQGGDGVTLAELK